MYLVGLGQGRRCLLETSTQRGDLRAPLIGHIELLYVSRYVPQLSVARPPMRSCRIMCNRSQLYSEDDS